MPLLVSGSIISPIDKRHYDALPNALIYVTDDGVIRAIHQLKPAGAPITEKEVDAFLGTVNHHGKLEKLHLEKGEFLIPGLIDTHTVRSLYYHSTT
jgi:hypothetical protein